MEANDAHGFDYNYKVGYRSPSQSASGPLVGSVWLEDVPELASIRCTLSITTDTDVVEHNVDYASACYSAECPLQGETYLEPMEGIHIGFPLLLVGYRLVLGYSPPRFASDLAEHIAVAAILVALLRLLLYHIVCPVRHNLPPPQARASESILLRASLHRHTQVPGDNEAVAPTTVQDTLGRGAPDKLCRRVQSEARDPESMSRMMCQFRHRQWRRRGRFGLYGDKQGSDRAIARNTMRR